MQQQQVADSLVLLAVDADWAVCIAVKVEVYLCCVLAWLSGACSLIFNQLAWRLGWFQWGFHPVVVVQLVAQSQQHLRAG